MDKQKFYSGGNEILGVYWDDTSIVELAIYRHRPDKLNFMERIKECLRILRGQSRFRGDIMLCDEQVKELAMDLLGGLKSRRTAKIHKKSLDK